MPPEDLERSAQFDAIRTTAWTYVEYGTGERELYDLARDPDQLENVVETADPALVAALAARLAELRTCAAPNAAGSRICHGDRVRQAAAQPHDDEGLRGGAARLPVRRPLDERSGGRLVDPHRDGALLEHHVAGARWRRASMCLGEGSRSLSSP